VDLTHRHHRHALIVLLLVFHRECCLLQIVFHFSLKGERNVVLPIFDGLETFSGRVFTLLVHKDSQVWLSRVREII